MPSDTIRILMRGMNLLRTRGWTRGTCARDKTGCPISYNDDSAASFCSTGATGRASKELGLRGSPDELADELLTKALPNGMTIIRFNDYEAESVDDVIAVFRKAIAKEAFG